LNTADEFQVSSLGCSGRRVKPERRVSSPLQHEIHVGRNLDQLIRKCKPDDSKDVARGPVFPEILLVDRREFEEVVGKVPHEHIRFDDLAPPGIEVRENAVNVVECCADLLFEIIGMQEVSFQVVGKLPGYSQKCSNLASLAVPIGVFPGEAETKNRLCVAHFKSHLIVEGENEAAPAGCRSRRATHWVAGVNQTTSQYAHDRHRLRSKEGMWITGLNMTRTVEPEAAAFWLTSARSNGRSVSGVFPAMRDVETRPEFFHYTVVVPERGDFGYVAEHSTEVIGLVWAQNLPPEDPGYGFLAGDTPEVSLWVRADWRGRGLGRALLRRVQHGARAREVPRLSLSVEADNYAKKLYLAEGFREVPGREADGVMAWRPGHEAPSRFSRHNR
jgi:ribosomal protein S18 acetylase RimI-like enzyme